MKRPPLHTVTRLRPLVEAAMKAYELPEAEALSLVFSAIKARGFWVLVPKDETDLINGNLAATPESTLLETGLLFDDFGLPMYVVPFAPQRPWQPSQTWVWQPTEPTSPSSTITVQTSPWAWRVPATTEDKP